VLEALGLAKHYGPVAALDGFTLSAQPGEIIGLVGHNGAGKSTFVEIVSALVRPDRGTVTVDGLPPGRARGLVGVAPQHLGLYPSVTVREHLRLFGRLAGLRGGALAGAIDEAVTALRLTGIVDRRTGALSGGQQRRTQVATAMLHRPPLLLLDEPTAGADLETRQAILDLVKQRAGEGAAVVYTTHYLPELTELRATIAVARAGRIVARGTHDDLVNGLPGRVRVVFTGPDGAPGEQVELSTDDPTRTLIDLLRRSERAVSAVEVHNPGLDELYHALAVDHAA